MNDSSESESESVTRATVNWVERVVVALNLCPFAKVPLANGAVRYCVAQAAGVEALLQMLIDELRYLDEHPDTETTLLIHPYVLSDFHDYNVFLALADDLLVELDREGVYQVASFHPGYQFAGTSAEDAENYSNRSPYPMLHLLREDSVEEAVEAHPDSHRIPERNVELLSGLGSAALAELLSACSAEGTQ